ncbi:MAG TPA: hypothetical protein VGD06_02070 [Acidobacteriota bacterium]
MALKDTVKDPLNWLLLLLAAAFAYYVIAIPYWQDFYLKQDPQVMTLQEYLANPSHPRPFMLRSLGAPPSSIEVVIEGLTVKHIDTDSITLTTDPSTIDAAANDACEAPPMLGDEQPVPPTDIMIAGDNMDLLSLSKGQQVSIQAFGVANTGLGLVPLEPTLESDQEERFNKDELDLLDQLKIHANGNTIRVPYVETGELRLADGVQPPGEPLTLEALADDTAYLQTAGRLAGNLADVYGVRLVSRTQAMLDPYFVVEDAEGRRARVYYNQRLLSEWRWALDRLQGRCVVVRGVLRTVQPADLRTLETEGNVQAIIEGESILSPDGGTVINLENPAGSLLGLGAPIQQ